MRARARTMALRLWWLQPTARRSLGLGFRPLGRKHLRSSLGSLLAVLALLSLPALSLQTSVLACSGSLFYGGGSGSRNVCCCLGFCVFCRQPRGFAVDGFPVPACEDCEGLRCAQSRLINQLGIWRVKLKASSKFKEQVFFGSKTH